jgi:putative transposase
MDELESLNHTKWECKDHIVFIPKCRRKTLYVQLREIRTSALPRQKCSPLRPLASFNLFPTGVHRWGRRWGRSAWRHQTSWWLRWLDGTLRATARSEGASWMNSRR